MHRAPVDGVAGRRAPEHRQPPSHRCGGRVVDHGRLISCIDNAVQLFQLAKKQLRAVCIYRDFIAHTSLHEVLPLSQPGACCLLKL